MKKNSTLAIIEYITNVVTLFFIYRIIIINLGVSGLGIWSLLISLFSITSLGNAGIASGTVKFIAEYKAKNDSENLLNVLYNSLIIVTGFTFILFILIFLILYILPSGVISQNERLIIAPLIPIIAFSYFLAIIGRIFLSVLDGLNLIYIRSIIGIIAKCFFLLFVILLLKGHGLMGLTIANCLQYIIIFLIAGFYNIKLIEVKFRKFGKYNRKIFKQILNYGLEFQLSSIFQMLMDPLTKFFLKDLGGLVSVGNFEILYKIFIQIRQFIVVIVVVYVPQISTLAQKSPKKLFNLFQKVSGQVLFMTFLLFNAAFCFMPLMILFMGASYNEELHLFSIIIYIALVSNLLGIVPYYFNSGTGDLRGNTISSFIMTFLNILLSIILGYTLNFDSVGILIAFAISQFIANIVLIISYQKTNKAYLIKSNSQISFIFLSISYLISSFSVNLIFEYELKSILSLNVFLLILYLSLIYFKNNFARELINKIKFIKKYG